MYIYLIFFSKFRARNSQKYPCTCYHTSYTWLGVFYDLNFENTFFIIQLKFYMTFLKITHFNKSIAFQQNSRMLYENDRSFQIFTLISVYGKSKVRKFQTVIAIKKIKRKRHGKKTCNSLLYQNKVSIETHSEICEYFISILCKDQIVFATYTNKIIHLLPIKRKKIEKMCFHKKPQNIFSSPEFSSSIRVHKKD